MSQTLGEAVGFVVSPNVVHSGADFDVFYLWTAIISSAIALLTFVLFRADPVDPSSIEPIALLQQQDAYEMKAIPFSSKGNTSVNNGIEPSVPVTHWGRSQTSVTTEPSNMNSDGYLAMDVDGNYSAHLPPADETTFGAILRILKDGSFVMLAWGTSLITGSRCFYARLLICFAFFDHLTITKYCVASSERHFVFLVC